MSDDFAMGFSNGPVQPQNPLSMRPRNPYQLDRSQVQFNGTGPHDDALARTQGRYRELPLRGGIQVAAEQPVETETNTNKGKGPGAWFSKVASQTSRPSSSTTTPNGSETLADLSISKVDNPIFYIGDYD